MGPYTADTRLSITLCDMFGFTSGFVPRLTTRVSVEWFHFSPNTYEKSSVLGVSFTSVGALELGSSFAGMDGTFQTNFVSLKPPDKSNVTRSLAFRVAFSTVKLDSM